MRNITAILLLSLTVAAGCSTARKTEGTSVPDADAAERAAKAAETLTAIPCRCDSLEDDSPWV
jgi:cytochrome c-type biogenesis protein CcmH/NrfF